MSLQGRFDFWRPLPRFWRGKGLGFSGSGILSLLSANHRPGKAAMRAFESRVGWACTVALQELPLVRYRQCEPPPGMNVARRFRHVSPGEREFFIDNLLVRIHFIIVMIRWTGLAPWEVEFPFPVSLTSTFLALQGT